MMELIEDFYNKNQSIITDEQMITIIHSICQQISTSKIQVRYNEETRSLNVY